MSRHSGSSREPRKLGRILLALSLTGMLAAINVGTAIADSIGSVEFELDGNAVTNGDEDWESIHEDNDTSVADTGIVDDKASTDDSFFKGGGSKDVRDISSWAYSSTDVAPPKDQLTNAYAAAYRNADQDLVLMFGSDRYANNGDSAIGFWFFKEEVNRVDGKFTGNHETGDILITSDFTGGGKVSTIKVFKWTANDTLQSVVNIEGDAASADCSNATHNAFICATENNGGETSPWPYQPSSGPADIFPSHSFLEGGINITDLVPGDDGCFAGFMAMSRSSTSTTSQLKDFVLARFPVCTPDTSMTASPTAASEAKVHRGESKTFTFNETNAGDLPLSNVSVSTTVTPSGTCATSYVSGNTDADNPPVLDPGETWVFQCTMNNLQADTTVVGTGHGTDFRGKDVTFCETAEDQEDPNKVCDQDERATAQVYVIHPQTTLTVSAAPATVHVGDTVTLSFSETNNGTRAYDNLTNVSVAASRCANAPTLDPANQAAAADSELDFGETWTYSCTFTAAGGDDGATIAAIASGTDVLGSTVTWCSNVNAPPTGVYCSQNERATTSIDIIHPSTSLRATASALVTYTFVETNNGDSDITNPSVAAPGCDSAVTITDRGADSDNVIEAGDSWTFTCTKTVAGPTAAAGVDVTGTGSGTDDAGANVTACGTTTPANTICIPDERDSVTVIINHNTPN